MESLSRYRLGRHEDGSWHVIDAKTGGPAEVQIEGRFYVLYRLSEEDAKSWSLLLNGLMKGKTDR